MFIWWIVNFGSETFTKGSSGSSLQLSNFRIGELMRKYLCSPSVPPSSEIRRSLQKKYTSEAMLTLKKRFSSLQNRSSLSISESVNDESPLFHPE